MSNSETADRRRPPMAQAIRQFVAGMDKPAKHRSEIAGTVLAMLQFSSGLATDAATATISPALSQLAEILWCSTPTVQRKLRRLREAGLLTQKGRGHASTLYTIHQTRQQVMPLSDASTDDVPEQSETSPRISEASSCVSEASTVDHLWGKASGVKPLEKERSKPKAPVFDVPSWIPIEPWEGFLEVRKRKRAPNTARAFQLIVGKLERLRAEGQDVAAVLDQSVERGWTGLFPLRQTSAAKPSRHAGFESIDYTEGLKQNSDGSYRL